MKAFDPKSILIPGALIALVILAGVVGYFYEYGGGNVSSENSSQGVLPTELPFTEPARRTATSPSPSSSTTSASTETGITFEEELEIRRPFPPQALQISLLSDGTIRLEWFDADSLIRYFRVHRKEASDDWIDIGRVEAIPGQERFSFIDKSAGGGMTYVYAVTAVNVHGNESEFSIFVPSPMPGQ